MQIYAETRPLSSLALVPGNFFTVYDFKAMVDVPEFELSSGGLPPMLIRAQGDVLIGGPRGFLCTLQGFIDTNSSAFQLEVSHAGGWSPLSGALGDLFKTPSFVGVVGFNMGGDYLTVSASADWITPIKLIPGWLEFTGLPPNTANGPSLSFQLVKATKDSPSQWEVGILAGIKFGSGRGAPPMILLNGTLRSCGLSELYASTRDEWQPLPSVLPGLRLPIIYGQLLLHENGLVEAEISHEPLPDLRLGSLLAFTGWQLTLGVTATSSTDRTDPECASDDNGAASGSTTTGSSANTAIAKPTTTARAPSPPPSYDVSLLVNVTGGIIIGGALDFFVIGTIDTASQSVSIEITHPGGWCPFDFLSSFCTPRIFGWFRMSRAEDAPYYLDLGAKISIADEISIIPGLVSIKCPAQGCYGGPEFGVSMRQQEKNGPRELSVYFSGATCLKLTSREYCLIVTVSADAEGRRQLTECVARISPAPSPLQLHPRIPFCSDASIRGERLHLSLLLMSSMSCWVSRVCAGSLMSSPMIKASSLAR